MRRKPSAPSSPDEEGSVSVEAVLAQLEWLGKQCGQISAGLKACEHRVSELEMLGSGCVVCMTRPAVYASVVCGHLLYCELCRARSLVRQIERCPLCREPLESTEQLLKIVKTGINCDDDEE